MENDLVSIIIVNWNGKRWLTDCFASLKNQNYGNYEIIFVDNASNDDSVTWVHKHYPNTKIVINKTNLGFAGANNVGYRKAKGKYVLFLNNDTRVTRTFLTELVDAMKPNVAGVQSKILLMDNPDTHDSVGAFLTPTGFLYHYGFGKKNIKKYDVSIPLYTAKGACMMFRRDVLKTVELEGNIFDPDYFAYFEESDLCHRVWLAGYKIVYAYKSVIYHKMGATSSGMNNAFIQYHSFKNRIRTFIKNFGWVWLLTIFPIHLLLCQLYAIISFIYGKHALGLAVERAFWWNMMNFPRTVHMRRRVQRHIRKINDSEIATYIFKRPKLTYYMNLLRGKAEE